jgi:N4-gp56 family major capsid protein
MARTIIGLNDAKAVKRYSGYLAVDIPRISYFGRKFMGEGETASMPIQRLTQLDNDAGEQITFDLVMQLKMQPVEGDSELHGKEEDLKFYTDQVYIDQMRGGVNTGGRMTRKRTLHDLRKVARKRQSEWWARVFDEIFFMYLSGARGINTEFVFPLTYAGFANNAFTAPDAEHIIYPGAKVKSTIDANDKFSLALIDKAVAYAKMMGGGTQETPKITPIMTEGEKRYVCVMNPWQEYDVRTATGTGQWLDIQKAAATAEGKSSPIFKGGLGMYNNVVLHEHEGIIRFNDYGGGTIEAARALFMGAQAAVCAFGSPGNGLRFDWHEESRDNGNQAVITTSSIFGVKKTTFNGKDFGLMAIDTAAKKP